MSRVSKSSQLPHNSHISADSLGNHDITLDHDFYSKSWQRFHNKNKQDESECLSLLTTSKTITYLSHESTTVRLKDPDGPGTTFTVFGSPYSPGNGRWAFDYEPAILNSAENPTEAPTLAASKLWAKIPENLDILVTHTPPDIHFSTVASASYPSGCRTLLRALARVRPRLHVCGHVHLERGVEHITWGKSLCGSGLSDRLDFFAERWDDPSPDTTSAKLSLVDLTSSSKNYHHDGRRWYPNTSHNPSTASPTQGSTYDIPLPPAQHNNILETGCRLGPSTDDPSSARRTGCFGTGDLESEPGPASAIVLGNDRRQTCVVNSAIVATTWPHLGGKRFNKPIVVDLDLPVWKQN